MARMSRDLAIDLGSANTVVLARGKGIILSQPTVIAMGGSVASRMMPVGGFDVDEAIQRYRRDEHGMAVGQRTAENLKIAIGSAAELDDEQKAEVLGREIESGAPKTVILSSEEIR